MHFFHIPRTGGTSIEHLFFGGNWWSHSKETKHLLASQAKRLYSQYWDKYFKFAFVRKPYTRTLSMLNFSQNYFSHPDSSNLTHEHRDGYKRLFGAPMTVEYDYRFYSLEECRNSSHTFNCVYGNLLDEPIDFIGKFENLERDVSFVASLLGVNQVGGLPHTAKSISKAKPKYASGAVKRLVKDLYYHDFCRFGCDY